MPIHDDIANSIWHENAYCSEYSDLLDSLTPQETEVFWDWFKTNANPYESNAIPFIPSQVKGIAGNCYDNAQMNAVRMGLGYCEGAYKACGKLVLHGFNIKEGHAIDFTVLKNIEGGQYNGYPIPVSYYGVTIPVEFVQQHLKDPNNTTHNPLLVKYFKHAKG